MRMHTVFDVRDGCARARFPNKGTAVRYANAFPETLVYFNDVLTDDFEVVDQKQRLNMACENLGRRLMYSR